VRIESVESEKGLEREGLVRQRGSRVQQLAARQLLLLYSDRRGAEAKDIVAGTELKSRPRAIFPSSSSSLPPRRRPRPALGRLAAEPRRVGAALDDARLGGERAEDAVGLGEQVGRRVELGHLARRHDEDLVAVHDCEHEEEEERRTGNDVRRGAEGSEKGGREGERERERGGGRTRVEPVRDDKDGARRKLAADDGLDVAVALDVDGGRGLVEDEDLAAPKERTAEADELPLAAREVGAALVDLRIELALLQDDEDVSSSREEEGEEQRAREGRTILSTCSLSRHCSRAAHICASVAWPDGSRFCLSVPANICESCGMMLRRERRSCRPILPTSTPSIEMTPPSGSTMRYRTCAHTVIVSSCERRGDRREGGRERETHHGERRLARARPAAHADLLARLDLEVDVAQHEIEVLAVARLDVLEADDALLRPVGRRLVGGDLERRLGLELGVLLDALDRHDAAGRVPESVEPEGGGDERQKWTHLVSTSVALLTIQLSVCVVLNA